MIGKVTFDSGGSPLTATLEDDGRWTCPEPFFERALNIAFPLNNYSPADGRRGWLQLDEAAKRYDGHMEVIDPGDPTPGLLF